MEAEKMTTNNITHIIDIEGFFVSKRIVYKELAIINVTTGRISKAHFILEQSFEDLSEHDKKTNRFVYRQVHGIPFKNFGHEKYYQCDIYNIIKHALKNTEKPLVAYKGGHIERDVLQEIGVAYVNLEDISCPNFNTLVLDNTYNGFKPVNCTLHKVKYTKKGFKIHCAAEEVQVFWNWWKKNCKKQENVL